MPYSYTIFSDLGLALVRGAGRVTGVDILQSIEAMTLDPDWKPGMRQLSDYRRITEFVITPEDLRAIADLERRREEEGRSGRGGKCAIVVLDEMYATACQLYSRQARGRSHAVEVFRSMESAIEWIGPDFDRVLIEAP
jgi:hypothetical protein